MHLTELAGVDHVFDVDSHSGPVKKSCILFGFFVSLVCGMEFLQYGFSGVLWRDQFSVADEEFGVVCFEDAEFMPFVEEASCWGLLR